MEKESSGWQGFLELCSKVHSPQELGEIFDLFFTHEEKETLNARYFIVKELLEGDLTQRELAERHKVSIAQITRGSNALKIVSLKLKALLKKYMSSS